MGAFVRQTFFHQPADLELDGTLAGDADFFHGLGVLGDAGGARADLEHAEVAEFQPVALSQFADDFFLTTTRLLPVSSAIRSTRSFLVMVTGFLSAFIAIPRLPPPGGGSLPTLLHRDVTSTQMRP